MSDAKHVTCGVLYDDALREFTSSDQNLVPIFAAGFVTGQAEKVHLGACRAAMFRPPETFFAVVHFCAIASARRYGLTLERLRTTRGVELWLCDSPETANDIRVLSEQVEDSEAWHLMRAALCGVSPRLIDRQFHLRRHGEK